VTHMCVGGTCGVRVNSCAELSDSVAHAVERPDLLENHWPDGNPPGDSILLAGRFDEQLTWCFGDKEIDLPYVHGTNAQLRIPSDAALGITELRAIDAFGRISAPRAIDVVAS